MTTIAEQETSVAWCKGENVVRIYSAYAPHVRRMRADPAYTEVRGTADCANFTIPIELYDPLRGRRRPRAVSDAERAARADRMREIRAMWSITPGSYLGNSIEPASDGAKDHPAPHGCLNAVGGDSTP